MSLFDPASIAHLPHEMLAQICQQAGISELQEFCAYPPLRQRLKSIISIASDSPTASKNPSEPFAAFFDFPLIDFTQETSSEVLLVDINNLEHFPLSHFKKSFLRNSKSKFVFLSGKASKIWTSGAVDLHMRKMPLKKLVNFFDDNNTVLILPSTQHKLSLRNTIITGLRFWAPHTLKELSLRNVNIVCKHDPFESLQITSLEINLLPHTTLEVMSFQNVKHLLIHTQGREVTDERSNLWIDYDSFFASRFDDLTSLSLESVELHGFKALTNWNVPSLKWLSIDMSSLTDDGACHPSLKHIKLPSLEVFEIHTPQSPHRAHEVQLPETCVTNVFVLQRSHEKYPLGQDELYRIVPNLSLEISDDMRMRLDDDFIKNIVHLTAETQTREAQKFIFQGGYHSLKSLTWNIVGGPEIASFSTLKAPCTTLTYLKVLTDPAVRIHLDFKYISRCFPNVKELDLSGCYYNSKLITQRDDIKVSNYRPSFSFLRKLHIVNYPPQVLDVIQGFFIPELEHIHVETDNSSVMKNYSLRFSLSQNRSKLHTIEIHMKGNLKNFGESKRHIFIEDHPLLKTLTVDYFNSMDIFRSPELRSVKINGPNAALNRFYADTLPKLYHLEYPSSKISKSYISKSYDEIPQVDRMVIRETEIYPEFARSIIKRIITLTRSERALYRAPESTTQNNPLVLSIKNNPHPADEDTLLVQPIIDGEPMNELPRDEPQLELSPVEEPLSPADRQPLGGAPVVNQASLPNNWVDELISGASFKIKLNSSETTDSTHAKEVNHTNRTTEPVNHLNAKDTGWGVGHTYNNAQSNWRSHTNVHHLDSANPNGKTYPNTHDIYRPQPQPLAQAPSRFSRVTPPVQSRMLYGETSNRKHARSDSPNEEDYPVKKTALKLSIKRPSSQYTQPIGDSSQEEDNDTYGSNQDKHETRDIKTTNGNAGNDTTDKGYDEIETRTEDVDGMDEQAATTPEEGEKEGEKEEEEEKEEYQDEEAHEDMNREDEHQSEEKFEGVTEEQDLIPSKTHHSNNRIISPQTQEPDDEDLLGNHELRDRHPIIDPVEDDDLLTERDEDKNAMSVRPGQVLLMRIKGVGNGEDGDTSMGIEGPEDEDLLNDIEGPEPDDKDPLADMEVSSEKDLLMDIEKPESKEDDLLTNIEQYQLDGNEHDITRPSTTQRSISPSFAKPKEHDILSRIRSPQSQTPPRLNPKSNLTKVLPRGPAANPRYREQSPPSRVTRSPNNYDRRPPSSQSDPNSLASRITARPWSRERNDNRAWYPRRN